MNTDFSQIMNYEDLLVRDFEIPYLFRIRGKKNNLFYFGSNHSYDVTDSQFNSLRRFWEEFISIDKDGKKIVLVEGGVRELATSENEAIEKNSEAGFTIYLARKAGIEVVSPEPAMKDEAKFLLDRFGKEEVEYYYFARMVRQWCFLSTRPSFEAYLEASLQNDRENLDWNDFDFSIKNLKSIHKKLFGGNFDERDVNFFNSVTTPMYRSTVINEVAQESSKFRDISIIDEILKNVSEGKNVFAVFGFTHAVMQEQALKRAIKE